MESRDDKIRRLRREGHSPYQLSAKFGLTVGTILQILKPSAWYDLGNDWQRDEKLRAQARESRRKTKSCKIKIVEP